MSSKRSLLAFGLAAVFWLIYFYGIDSAIMRVQGLPVGWNLMPR